MGPICLRPTIPKLKAAPNLTTKRPFTSHTIKSFWPERKTTLFLTHGILRELKRLCQARKRSLPEKHLMLDNCRVSACVRTLKSWRRGSLRLGKQLLKKGLLRKGLLRHQVSMHHSYTIQLATIKQRCSTCTTDIVAEQALLLRA